jgi:hypothetical protein
MARRIWVVGLLLAIIIVTAEATRAYTAPAEPQTRVETDQAAGAIRFIVKGQEQARIDSTGLHVRHHIDYGGAITDEGAAGYAAAFDTRVKSAQ